MNPSFPKTFAEVRAAFETRKILACSDKELQQLLVALGAETITDPALRVRAAEMSATMRQLLEGRRNQALRSRTRAVIAALCFSVVALLCAGVLAYQARSIHVATVESVRSANEDAASYLSGNTRTDARTHLTVAELASHAPSLRRGTLQAWWAGEQARQIQRLEGQAKRQALAGDFEGAALSASRADTIRNAVESLADFEKPPTP